MDQSGWYSLKGNEKKTPLELGKLFVDAIKFNYKQITDVIQWPAFAGKDLKKSTTAIRVKIPYSFWAYFTQTGEKMLGEFNKKNQCEIRVSKDKTVVQADIENLGMMMRKLIKEEFSKNGTGGVKINGDHVLLVRC